MNPVKAKITAHPEDYTWSSYRTILRMTDDRITKPEKILAFFKQNIVRERMFCFILLYLNIFIYIFFLIIHINAL